MRRKQVYSDQTYDILLAPELITQLRAIQNYKESMVWDLSTKNYLSGIFDDIEKLDAFPHQGLLLKEKIDLSHYQDVGWRCILIDDQKYLVIYDIDEERHQVTVLSIFATQSDYTNAILKMLQ